jgi:hypothetical protein
MPRTVYDLMDLYPQANTQRPSVIYVPMRSTRDAKAEPQAPGKTPSNNGTAK